MKTITTAAAALSLTFGAYAPAQNCNDALKIVMQTTEFKTEEAFNQHLRKYFFSDTFNQDIKDKRFKASYLGDSGKYDGKYDEKRIAEFREKLVVDDKVDISSAFKAEYLETKANKDALEAWKFCLEKKYGSGEPVLALVKEANDEAVLSLTHKTIGAAAKVVSVVTIGCKQKLTDGKLAFKKDAIFKPGKPLTALFVKIAQYPDPSVIITTSMGVVSASLKQFPAPPRKEAPPEDLQLRDRIIKAETFSMVVKARSEHLTNQDFSAANNSCIAELSWQVLVTPDWRVQLIASGKIWEPATMTTVPKFAVLSMEPVTLLTLTDIIGKYGKDYDLFVEYGEGRVKEGIFTLPCRPGGGGKMSGGATWLVDGASVHAGGGGAIDARFDFSTPRLTVSLVRKP